MFFVLSKVLGFFVVPSNLLMAVGLLGLLLLFTRHTRFASWLIVTAVVLLAIVGYSPLGNALILPLEERFPPWDATRGTPDGIIVLGGALSPDISLARGTSALDEAAERVTAAAELAQRYPAARILLSGGSGALIFDEGVEADLTVRQLEALGVARERMTAEGRSRSTLENALFARAAADPRPGQRWLLVTSAYHMPRAIAAFRAANFPVEAYPVDWRTRGSVDLLRPFASLSDGLGRTDTAVHEWIGLLAYRLSGRTAVLFPSP